MTEVNIDAYFSKLQDIKTLCENSTSTLEALTTNINNLSSLMDDIDIDIETMPFPTTVSHLQKFILIFQDRCSLINLQNMLYGFIKIRNSYSSSILDLGDLNSFRSYTNDTENIKQYINGLKETFIPMKIRDNVISFIVKS